MMNMRMRDNVGSNLQARLADLTAEMAAIKKQMAAQGHDAYQGAAETGGEIAHWVRDQAAAAMPEIRRGSRYLRRVARENPSAATGTALLGVFILGAAAAMMFRSKR